MTRGTRRDNAEHTWRPIPRVSRRFASLFREYLMYIPTCRYLRHYDDQTYAVCTCRLPYIIAGNNNNNTALPAQEARCSSCVNSSNWAGWRTEFSSSLSRPAPRHLSSLSLALLLSLSLPPSLSLPLFSHCCFPLLSVSRLSVIATVFASSSDLLAFGVSFRGCCVRITTSATVFYW